MTPEQFCYWLQGYFELNGGRPLVSVEQSKTIQDHLDLVFKKVTPDRKDDARSKFQQLLNEATEKLNPYDRPGVYCAESAAHIAGSKRIC